jgi:poly-gamma-glutamate synthesis protein (capsule biosynthesis protein)
MKAVSLLIAALVAAIAVPGEALSPKPGGKVREIVVSVSGDLLIHEPVWEAARAGGGYDFAPLFRKIRPHVRRADLAICHVEVPMGAGPPQGYPTFNSPPELARGIAKTGWDACSTASNHTLDQGLAGVRSTLGALNRAGIRHAGSYRSERRSRRPMIFGAGAAGVKVALLAYTTDLNGIAPPAPWVVDVLHSAEQVRHDAKQAVRAGAEAVIVNVHWASQIKPEYTSAPSPGQLALARRIARINRVTALVGQGPHVVQPIGRLEKKLVVLGEGNLISNQTAACCAAASQDGLIALLHIRVGASHAKLKRVGYAPVWVRHPDYRVLPVGRAYRRGWAGRDALADSWRRTTGTVGEGRGVRPVPRRLRG